MNILTTIFTIILQSIIATYFCITFSKILTKKNYSKKRILCAFIFSIVTITVSSLLKNVSTILNFLSGYILLCTLSMLILQVKFIKSNVVFISYYIFMALVDIITVGIYKYIFGISVTTFQTNAIVYIVTIIIQTLLQFAALSLIRYSKKIKSVIKNILQNLSTKMIIIFILATLTCIIPQLLLFVIFHFEYPLPLILCNTIQLIIVSIIIFSLLFNMIKQTQLTNDLMVTEIHNKTLSEIVDSVRTQKHDYNNTIQALNGYIITKQYDSLSEYVNKLISDCNAINTLSTIDPIVINDPAIYGIVGAKYFFANENNISFDIEIITDVKDINFSKIDLSRILGILLDNALEATRKAKEQYIKLEMRFDNRRNADIIRVLNSYDTNLQIDTNQIFDKGVSSKEIKSGIGLWEVKKIISKNKHSQIFANIENGKFIQTLIIKKAYN